MASLYQLVTLMDRTILSTPRGNLGWQCPQFKLFNRAKKKVLVVEGEELVGTKQNRIVNSTFLITGKSDLALLILIP